jgi:hypothetical protein
VQHRIDVIRSGSNGMPRELGSKLQTAPNRALNPGEPPSPSVLLRRGLRSPVTLATCQRQFGASPAGTGHREYQVAGTCRFFWIRVGNLAGSRRDV